MTYRKRAPSVSNPYRQRSQNTRRRPPPHATGMGHRDGNHFLQRHLAGDRQESTHLPRRCRTPAAPPPRLATGLIHLPAPSTRGDAKHRHQSHGTRPERVQQRFNGSDPVRRRQRRRAVGHHPPTRIRSASEAARPSFIDGGLRRTPNIGLVSFDSKNAAIDFTGTASQDPRRQRRSGHVLPDAAAGPTQGGGTNFEASPSGRRIGPTSPSPGGVGARDPTSSTSCPTASASGVFR